MSANTVSNLILDAYTGVESVAMESTGVIGSVSINTTPGAGSAALGQQITSVVTSEVTAGDWTPAMTATEGTGQTFATKYLTITKQRSVKVPWRGEEIASVSTNGIPFRSLQGGQIQQAMRTLVNEISTDLITDIVANCCRSVGVSGTNPFATNFNVLADGLQVFTDNGFGYARTDGQLSAVVNSLSETNLMKIATLQTVNTSGSTDLLRNGTILDIFNTMIKVNHTIPTHTAGTGASATTDSAGYAAGATTITLASAGTGTILAGDVITFAGSTEYEYVVVTGDADVSNGGSIVIQEPGLMAAIAAAPTAITVKATYKANAIFHRSAVELAMRGFNRPKGMLDISVAREMIPHPSGLTFDMAIVPGNGMYQVEIGASWGYKVWRPELAVSLRG